MSYENDIHLSRNLAAESANRSSFLKSLTTRNILFGSAAVAAAVGLGLAACIWAYNQGLDPKLLEAALAKMPTLKIEQVKLDPNASTVKLDPNAIVKLDADPLTGSVKLETVPLEGVVTLDATVLRDILEAQKPVVQPDISKQPERTKTGDVIKREVTVFSEVLHAGGKVVTGWKYKDGESKTPFGQFCYYGKDEGTQTQKAHYIGYDGKVTRDAQNQVPQFETAYNKCIWFHGDTNAGAGGPNKKRSS